MIELRNWGQVISEVEHSGQNHQKKQKLQSRQRQIFLRQENKYQMDYERLKKMQEGKKKSLQRVYAESLDKIAYEKQRQIKELARNRELAFRAQNKKIIEQRQRRRKQNLQNKRNETEIFRQNPLTAEILHKHEERRRKSREINLEYATINSLIIKEKYASAQKITLKETIEGDELERFTHQRLKKLSDEKYRFYLPRCNPQIKSQKLVTEPNTQQKDYGSYLQQEILFNKVNKDQVYKNSMKVKAQDTIDDQNIFKINYNAQKQSASPAYLGRLPYSHDRMRQLSYIDKEIYRQARIKTENSYQPSKQHETISYFPADPEKDITILKNSPQIPEFSPYNQISKPITLKTTQPPKPPSSRKKYKAYKQFNILTGSHIMRNQYMIPKSSFAA